MKDKIITLTFIIFIYTFSILFLFHKDTAVSLVERRKLTTISKLQEDFTTNLDPYLTDQFPMRNLFLTLNNTFNRYLLGNNYASDVSLKGEYIIAPNYPLDSKSLQNFTKKINTITKNYFPTSNCYSLIIPDKSYFLDNNQDLKINYDYLYDYLSRKLTIPNINIHDLLTLSDYYQTDIHLEQSSYLKIIPRINDYLNFNYQNISYTPKTYANFKGSDFYKVPFQKPEKLTYLTNDLLSNITVKHLDYLDNYIYKEEALTSGDAYNLFLSGPSSLIELTNEDSPNNRELIIFRDSFASSLAPLLIPFYHKITLIDLRYTNMNIISKYIDFHNQDILFFYSTLIVNNSFILK